MAGFAINLSYLLTHDSVKFKSSSGVVGFQETKFLEQFRDLQLEDLQPVSIKRVLVWHTRTAPPKLDREEHFRKTNGHGSDFEHEV